MVQRHVQSDRKQMKRAKTRMTWPWRAQKWRRRTARLAFSRAPPASVAYSQPSAARAAARTRKGTSPARSQRPFRSQQCCARYGHAALHALRAPPRDMHRHVVAAATAACRRSRAPVPAAPSQTPPAAAAGQAHHGVGCACMLAPQQTCMPRPRTAPPNLCAATPRLQRLAPPAQEAQAQNHQAHQEEAACEEPHAAGAGGEQAGACGQAGRRVSGGAARRAGAWRPALGACAATQQPAPPGLHPPALPPPLPLLPAAGRSGMSRTTWMATTRGRGWWRM